MSGTTKHARVPVSGCECIRQVDADAEIAEEFGEPVFRSALPSNKKVDQSDVDRTINKSDAILG